MEYKYYLTILSCDSKIEEVVEADQILFKDNSIIFVANGGSQWIYLKVFPASRTIIQKIERNTK